MDKEISLRQTRVDELNWILQLEADAREEGFIRGNDAPAHRNHLADPQIQYLTILQGDEPVGFVILLNIETQDRNVELGRLIIGPRERGIGQSAMRVILRYAFEELGAHRVWLDTLSHNVPAQHVYEKLGFTREGVARQALLFDGKYHDLLLYGLLVNEWSSR